MLHVSKQWRIYVIIWLTGVWGEEGAALAVDDLFNKRQFLRHRCRNHTEARHQGIKRCNSSHHSKVGVKVWKREEKRSYSAGSAVKITHTIKLAYFNSHVCAYSLILQSKWYTGHNKRLHSHSWINHLVNNMHILRSLQEWAILCHPSCLDNDLDDIVHSRFYKNRALLRFTLQHCTGIHSDTRLCAVCGAFWNGNDAGLQYMPHSICRAFRVGNYATRCLMSMSLNKPCSRTQIFKQDMKFYILDLL